VADEEATNDRCSVENNLYLQCLCEQSIRISDNQEFKKCVICKETENLKSDLDEFNNILGIASCQVVKAIWAGINVVLVKIDSIKASTHNWQKNEASWSEVIKGSKKPVLLAGQPILVLNNRSQPLSTLNDCDSERRFSMHEQKK
jgi:hypothetical protein